jgi:peptide/nickel transport system permease protein
MLRYILSRLVQLVPVMLGLSLLVFVVIRAIPGDPAVVLAGPDASEEQLTAIHARLGLDQPLPVQYGIWLGNVLRGDLGSSYAAKIPVTELVGQRLAATLYLTFAAMTLALLISFPLGLLCAVSEGSILDSLVSAASGIAMSLPGFWLGLLLVLAFSLQLGWLPPSGYLVPGRGLVQSIRLLILPAVTLAVPLAAIFLRFIRAELLQTLGKDYTRTARAKGLSEMVIMLHHVLPNAMIPVVTAIGLQLSRLLGGAVVVEIIFAWPGVGRLVVQAINDRDYATVQGVLLVLSLLFVLVSLITDLCYGLLDPRISRAGGNR